MNFPEWEPELGRWGRPFSRMFTQSRNNVGDSLARSSYKQLSRTAGRFADCGLIWFACRFEIRTLSVMSLDKRSTLWQLTYCEGFSRAGPGHSGPLAVAKYLIVPTGGHMTWPAVFVLCQQLILYQHIENSNHTTSSLTPKNTHKNVATQD